MANIKGKETICATCLSSNRRLIPLCTLRNVIKEINFSELEKCKGRICWDCRSIVVKFHSFKIKALEAQSVWNKSLKRKNLKSMSSFKTRHLVITDQKYKTSDALINCDKKPKLEKVLKVELEDILLSTDISKMGLKIDPIDNTKLPKSDNEEIGSDKNDEPVATDDDTNDQEITFDDDEDNEMITLEIDMDDDISDQQIEEDDDKTDDNLSSDDQVDIYDRKVFKHPIKTKYDKEIDLEAEECKEKFTKVALTDNEIILQREKKRMHYCYRRVPYKCDSCVLAFKKKESLDLHMKKKHDEKIGPFKCAVCDTRFETKSQLAQHRGRHRTCYRCILCKYEAVELYNMLKHCRAKHKRDSINNIHCSFCDTIVKSAEELEKHIDAAHMIPCKLCGGKFRGKISLRKHTYRIHKQFCPSVCPICNESFPSKSRLETHMTYHSEEIARKMAYCAECDLQFNNIHKYRQHLKINSKHINETFPCPECGKHFTTKAYQKQHYKFHHLRKSDHYCQECDKIFVSDWVLKKHMQTYHGLNRPRNLSCDVCGKAFFCPRVLRNHKLIHSEERTFMCEDCGDTFKQSAALYTHSKLVHGPGRKKKYIRCFFPLQWLKHCKAKHKRDSINNIHCSFCDTIVKSAEELEKHIDAAHMIPCKLCGGKFRGKISLRKHTYRIHKQFCPSVCPICNESFPSKSRLETHMTYHSEEIARKMAYCAECDLQFNNIHKYRQHLKINSKHINETFPCPECGKHFTTKAYQKQHYKFHHLRKSDHYCQECDKIFVSDWVLKKHMQTYHGLNRPRNLSCDVCGKAFFCPRVLRNHKLIHSEERTFMCEDCGDTFKQSAALYTHSKLVHGPGRKKK